MFSDWLSGKLSELGTDESVFGPYIISILEEESGEDQKEGLTAILSDVLSDESLIDKVLQEILDNWEKHSAKENENIVEVKSEKDKLDISDQMHKIMEEQMANFKVHERSQTEEEKKLKAAILASYSEVADGSEDEESGGDDDDLGSNSNVEAVKQAQAEYKEAQKQAAMAKKEKDKQDRENQKKQQEDRKKKAQEKAAKGERRSGR